VTASPTNTLARRGISFFATYDCPNLFERKATNLWPFGPDNHPPPAVAAARDTARPVFGSLNPEPLKEGAARGADLV